MWQALRAEGRSARADAGVSRPHQLCELVALRLGEGKLEPADYYKLRLYRRGLSFEEKRKYFSNQAIPPSLLGNWAVVAQETGRASGRERVCQYVYISVVDVS